MTRSSSAGSRIAAALLVACLAWLAGAPALAEGEKIPMNVLVTHISKQGSGVDPGALELDRRLRKQIVYESIRVIKEERMNLTLNEVARFKLPNGKAVRMRPLNRDERGVLMAVDVEGAARLDARVMSRKPLVIRAGPYQGGSLVVSLELDD